MLLALGIQVNTTVPSGDGRRDVDARLYPSPALRHGLT